MVIEAAFAALETQAGEVVATSPVIDSAPIGPSLRQYANAVAVIESPLEPSALLHRLHQLEAAFGRGRNQRRGSRWRARALDLDIVLWSGGIWESAGLIVPHAEFRNRGFVLEPAQTIAPDWRDPVTGCTITQLAARNKKGA